MFVELPSIHRTLCRVYSKVEVCPVKPILVRNSRIPALFSWFFPVAAIALWPFVFFRPGCDRKETVTHESIHILQYNELYVIGFLAIYLYDWLRGLWKYTEPREAYRRIRFEQEAREHQDDPEYLKQREPFAWKKYFI